MRLPEFSLALALPLLSELDSQYTPSDSIYSQTYITTSDISTNISITISISTKPSVPSLPVPSLNVTQPQFLLQIGTSGSLSFSFGGAPLYVLSQGTLTTCQFATAFALVDNQLYADRQLVSTSTGTLLQPFVTSSSSGGISDRFSLVNGVLQWSNPSFAANSATFCLSTSNTVLAVSSPSAIPSGCIPITLTQVPYTQCFPTISIFIPSAYPGTAGANGAAGATGPSGAAGANGTAGATGPSGAAGANGTAGATGPSGAAGANGTAGATGPSSSNGISGGYTAKYGYLGCYNTIPDGNYGLFPLKAQENLTTSLDGCATFCAGQNNGSLYMSLGTTPSGNSICSCGDTLATYTYYGLNFQCNIPCVMMTPQTETHYCGGYYYLNPLVSVFGAV